MKDHFKRFWGLYCSIIVVGILLCGGIAGIFAWNFWQKDASQGQVIPSSSGGTTTIIETEIGIVNPESRDDGDGSSMIRLSEGQAQPQTVEQLPLATGEPLTDEEIQRIVSRLPELEAASEDVVDFNFLPNPYLLPVPEKPFLKLSPHQWILTYQNLM